MEEVLEEKILDFYNFDKSLVQKKITFLKHLYSNKEVKKVNIVQKRNPALTLIKINFYNGISITESYLNNSYLNIPLSYHFYENFKNNLKHTDPDYIPEEIIRLDDFYEYECSGILPFVLNCKDLNGNYVFKNLFNYQRDYKKILHICELVEPYYQDFEEDKLDLWIVDDYLSIVFKKDDFVISNEEGLEFLIQGLYFFHTYKINNKTIIFESGFRDKLSFSELNYAYFHSHLPSIQIVYDLNQYLNEEEEFSDLPNEIYEEVVAIYENNNLDVYKDAIYLDDRYYLCNGGSKNYGWLFNNLKVDYNKDYHSLIPSYINKFLEHESISGTPWRYIKDIAVLKGEEIKLSDLEIAQISIKVKDLLKKKTEINQFEIAKIFKELEINTVVDLQSMKVLRKSSLKDHQIRDRKAVFNIILSSYYVPDLPSFKGKLVTCVVDSEYDKLNYYHQTKSLNFRNYELTDSFINKLGFNTI